ncbi:MAG: putative trigger factor [Pseudomonadota bacterium]
MAITVETLEKLERKITLSLPLSGIQSEIDARLRKLARTVKMDGFRPGKVPMNVVSQRYAYSVQMDVMNDKIGEAFDAAIRETQLRVAGQPNITPSDHSPADMLNFDAVFEVFPDVQIGDLAAAEVEKIQAEVTEAAIDKTIDILRKQRRTFSVRPEEAGVEIGDRVTVDFEGKIDGEPFAGGKADDFQFIVGDGQMLREFEDAAVAMKLGESKTFPLAFPADYHGKDVAGKTADFMVTIKKAEAAQIPELNEELAKFLGIPDATMEGLRTDIRSNLEREVRNRLLARNKQGVLEALLAQSEFDLPQSSVKAEVDRLIAGARADWKQRGVKDADTVPISEELFRPQAEKRVRLGLLVAQLVRANNLYARPEQIQAHIEEMAASYENPAEVVNWYSKDQQRLTEVEGAVVEKNVTEFVLASAKVTEKMVTFDELMTQA